jgi:ribonuclease-3
MTDINYEQISKALRLLNQGLYLYTERQMQSIYEDWLSEAKGCLARDYPQRRTIEKTLREDVSALLILISRVWESVFKKSLSHTERALVSELIEVRNQWAHGAKFSTEDTYRALDSMTRLLTAIAAPEAEAIAQLRQETFKRLAQEQTRPEIRKSHFSAKEEYICIQLSDLLNKIPFNNALLLYRALTHRSYMFEHPTETEGDNEQLEFLGDSVLGFLAGDYFYQRYPGRKEDELTKRRSNLVENSTLAELAKTWDLGRWMLLGKGEESTGGRTKTSLLSNTFEAVIGAYYLDSGIEAVRTLLTPLFGSVADAPENNITSQPAGTDPIGQLQHYALTEHKQTPEYVDVDESGPAHAKTFTVNVQISGKVYGTGTGSSKKEAKKQAALAALRSLG